MPSKPKSLGQYFNYTQQLVKLRSIRSEMTRLINKTIKERAVLLNDMKDIRRRRAKLFRK